MTMNNNHILELWKEFEQSQSNGHFKRLFQSNKPFHIYVTYQYPERYYGIAFVISDNFRIDISAFDNLKDLKVALVADHSFENSRLLTIQLLTPFNRDIFATLCNDVIQSVIDIVSEKKRVRTIINQLDKWRSMFDKINSNGLSLAEQQGLYGELNFLQKILVKSGLQASDVLHTWVGVDKALRDFQGSNWAVEVKTTATNNPQDVKISSERQLDETLLNSLYLYHCSVETSKANGQTLCDKIEEIRSILSEDIPALTTFNAKLFEAGYTDTQSNLYKDRYYQIRFEKLYRIDEDFPRIKENELRDGVGNVTYSIVLAMCDNYLVTENQVISDIQNL